MEVKMKRDILNSSKDPLKSSKIIAFWSYLVTLFGCFNCAKKSCISQLLRKKVGCGSDSYL